jgi:hypothetical protein
MDERNIRTGRTTDVNPDVDRDVEIRRTMVMGRDLDYTGTPRVLATAPINRVVTWGPIFAGLITTIVSSLLLGALALGLGFQRQYGIFGGLTSQGVGWGTVIISLVGVFIGAYFTGYVSNLRTKNEGILNGLMVGMMTIFTPMVLSALGLLTLGTAAVTNVPTSTNPVGTAGTVGTNVANTMPPSVTNALTLAADNAWIVFVGGLLILGIGALAGFLGAKSREKAVETRVSRDIETGRAVV